ncbi:MAG: Ig-like domain-containing protein, partial [Gammaproteobacteria bacterium]
RARMVPNGRNGDFVGDPWGDQNGGRDCHGHGTHVAGTVGGAAYGVAKGVSLWAARVLDCSGFSRGSSVIAAIDWVTGSGSRPAVVNMSLGGPSQRSLREAVERSVAAGFTYAIAAGNGDALGRPVDACSQSPADARPALTIGATEIDDDEASFSNFGTCVDLLAPGVAITSAWYTGDDAQQTLSGTSMATPHVAGAAALYLGTHRGAGPGQVAQALIGLATPNTIDLHPASRSGGTPNLLLFTEPPGGDRPPVVTILSPLDGATFPTGSVVRFEGTATDAVEGDLSDRLVWTSSLDGELGRGRTVSAPLRDGIHRIQARVLNSQGVAGQQAIAITVGQGGPNTAPTVAITTPLNGAFFESGTLITFAGTATDAESGDLTTGLVWRSDRAGEIGRGGQFQFFLPDGTHRITAAVTDPQGLSGSATILVTVLESNGVFVEILSPADGSVFASGDPILFEGTASAEDGRDVTATLVWRSDRDGLIGRGGSFVRALSDGEHVITARARAGRGQIGIASVRITVGGAGGNTPPEVLITSPADGSTYAPGTPIPFRGSASDAEDGDLTGKLVWLSSLDGTIGQGGAFDVALSQGVHAITARVTDSRLATTRVSITVTVAPRTNQPPTVVITSPPDGATFPVGTPVEYVGSATDPEEGDISGRLVWSVDGVVIGTGPRVTAPVTAGTHLVGAVAQDAEGEYGVAFIAVTGEQGNTPPTVTILNPRDGATFVVGAPIRLDGTASDAEDGSLTHVIAWYSSVDGPLGHGTGFQVALSQGTHEIIAQVRDTRGELASTSVTIEVTPPPDNQPPTVRIINPHDGQTFVVGAQIRFDGTASDPEDGSLTHVIAWYSSRDGPLGQGTGFRVALSRGTHEIIAQVRDTRGVLASTSVTIEVVDPPPDNQAPSVAILQPADGRSFRFDAVIAFVGTASDPEDGDLTGDLVWESSLDGEIGRGG